MEFQGPDAPSKLVCMVTGDGSLIFVVLDAVLWAQYRGVTSFLSVVVKNEGWKATRSCLADVCAEGIAAKVTDEELGVDL